MRYGFCHCQAEVNDCFKMQGYLLIHSVPCEYPMADGESSLAIVVGLSSRYMGEVLFLDSDS